jgi:hypothetical protein
VTKRMAKVEMAGRMVFDEQDGGYAYPDIAIDGAGLTRAIAKAVGVELRLRALEEWAMQRPTLRAKLVLELEWDDPDYVDLTWEPKT